MNARRVAELLEEQKRINLELASELGIDLVPAPGESAPRPKKKVARVRRARVPLAPPASQVSDVDRAAARAHLRRQGYR